MATRHANGSRFLVERTAPHDSGGLPERLKFVLVLAVLALATFLTNAYGRSSFPFWPDEAYTVLAVRAHNWNELLVVNLRNEMTPPLYFALLRLWSLAWGDSSEATLRLFSAVCLAASVPLVAWLGQRVWTRQVGLVGAALLAVNPFAHYYGQEARCYALTVLFSTAVLLAAHAYLHHPRPCSWMAFILTGAAALYTNYLAGFVLAAASGLVGLLLLLDPQQPLRKRLASLGGWLLAQAVIVLILSAWLPGVTHQLMWRTGWTGYPVRAWLPWLPEINAQAIAPPAMTVRRNILAQYGLSLLVMGGDVPDGSLLGSALIVLVAIALLVAIVLAFRWGSLEQRSFMVAILFIPTILIVLVLRGDPKFNTRYLIASAPAYVLLLAAGLTRPWRWQAASRVVLIGVAILSAIYCFSALPSSQRRGGWDTLARIVEAQAQEGDAIFFTPAWVQPAFTVQYTGRPLPLYGVSSIARYHEEGYTFEAAEDNMDTASLQAHLRQGKRAWIVWDRVYALRPHIPAGCLVEEQSWGSTSLLLLRTRKVLRPPSRPVLCSR